MAEGEEIAGETVGETDEWLSDLREACEVSMDAEDIRRRLKNKRVPEDLRPLVWQVLLRVRNKPDALSAATKVQVAEHDNPLKEDCKLMGGRFSKEAGCAEDMERILSHYIRSRGLEYDSKSGWAELLAPFMAIPMTTGESYNCFYVFMAKYAIQDISGSSVAFEVLRLLLLYHDAELCAVLDTLRVTPKDFTQTWFRSMFSHTCGPEIVLPLWDAYFLADDPFFVFFLALVMLVNGREYVMQLAQTPDTLCQELENMPSGLTTDDIQDMCDLAQHFSSITPSSFRADYSTVLFGTRPSSRASTRDVFHTLSLSIPVETVLRHTEGAIKYFIVDIRPLEQYEAGHLPYAWHLDAGLMMENPTNFAKDVAALEDALETSLQHPCFLSSGRPEDEQHLSMVVSHFLQKKQKYVSVVRGGFKALHARLDFETRTAAVLESHAPARCLECQAAEAQATGASASTPPTSKGSPKVESKWGNRLKGWGNAWRESSAAAKEAYRRNAEKLAEKSAEYKAALKEKSKAWSEKMKEKSDKGGQGGLYRQNDRTTFSIDDDDEDVHSGGRGGGVDLDLPGAILRRTSTDEFFVSVSKAKQQPKVLHYFKCSEVSHEGYLFPSHLILTSTHLLKLRDQRRKDEAVVLSRRELSRIQRITAKKKHPNILTFFFDVEGGIAGEARFPESPRRSTSVSVTSTPVVHKGEGKDDVQPIAEDADNEKAEDSSKADEQPSIEDAKVAQSEVQNDGDESNDTKESHDKESSEEKSEDVPSNNQETAPVDDTGGDTKSGDAEVSTEPTADTNNVNAPLSPPETPSKLNESSEPDSPSRNMSFIQERFMIPEYAEAKQAFKVLIASNLSQAQQS
eukprot:m.3507 g.3507  ORF g.3507 m.3507 type:complete len:854 (-) comp2781_c0_seq2:96-2657(-)